MRLAEAMEHYAGLDRLQNKCTKQICRNVNLVSQSPSIIYSIYFCEMTSHDKVALHCTISGQICTQYL